MKKYIIAILAVVPMLVSAAPWDLNGQQYDQFGTSMINRLMPLPSGGASAIYIYNSSLNLPKLATVDSTLSISSGNVVGISSSTLSGLATTTALAGKFDNPTGSTSQYLRGDGSLATFPTIPNPQVNSDWTANTGVAQILNKPTFATVATTGAYSDLSGTPSIPAAQVNSDWNAISGVAQILNKPSIPSAQVNTDWNSVSGVSQLLNKPTVVSAFTNDSAYINQAGARNAVSLTTTGSGAATYNNSTGVLNVPTPATPASKVFNNNVTRTLNTAYQISSTRETQVTCAVDVTINSLLTTVQGTIALQYADDSGMSTNLQTVMSVTSSIGGVLNIANTGSLTVGAVIPTGKYVRLQSTNNSGTPTYSSGRCQEVLL